MLLDDVDDVDGGSGGLKVRLEGHQQTSRIDLGGRSERQCLPLPHYHH